MTREIKRREFMLGLGGALAAKRPARVQPKRMPVVGALASHEFMRLGPFEQGLADAGFDPDENVATIEQFASDRYEDLPKLATDLVRRKVDVIAAFSLTAGLAARRATDTIPIVTWAEADPVAAGLAASLTRPGGNVTGILTREAEATRKRLDLLLELVPKAKLFALLVNPKAAFTPTVIHSAQDAAHAKGVELRVVEASSVDDIGAAYATLSGLKADGLVVEGDLWLLTLGIDGALVKQAARDRLPAIYGWGDISFVGGLIAYGANRDGVKRQMGLYAGRVLRGAKPADLPFKRAKKFELFVDLKTAKTLGLTVPQSLLARADQVIR